MPGSEQAIHVQVHFEAQLRELADENPATLSCAAESPLLEVLRSLDSAMPVFDRLFDSDHAFRGSILVFLNDKPVNTTSLDSTIVHDGDTVLLYPPISGG